MSAAPAPANERLRLARSIAQAGYRIFPLKPDTKEPATRHGFKDATSDAEQVEIWWTEDPTYGIGLATGMQDNGMFVAVVDVDAKHGGVLAWKQLTRDNSGGWQRYMPIHKTPRAGFHIFGQVDPALGLNASNGFPRGIDTRGEGGYVVLPDSRFIDPDTGEIGNYVCTENNLWSTGPGAFPQWVLDLWLAGPQRETFQRHPSNQPVDGDSPLAWMKANINWFKEIQDDKFTLEADFGGEVRWTRPGKTRGTSLSLHLGDNGGCVVVWSDNCPEWMVDRRCGQPTSDGHWSLNGFQYICARDYGGDVRAAMSGIRLGRMPQRQPPPARQPEGATPAAVGVGERSALDSLCLPEWFWTQRPWLLHLRDAAWSVGSVPDALLAAVIGRISTICSPKWVIPPIIHDEATLDAITVIVGHSGTGKSAPLRRAARLLPSARRDLRFGLGISSGEGMIEAYYGMVDELGDDGKVRKVRKQAFTGVHFTVDEGALLASLGGRSGWTGVDRILTAWSGGALSTPNASAERFRHIEAGTYRFAMTMAIQADLADGLWAGGNTAQGFTGRLTFFSGLSTAVPLPGERPDDPGELLIELPMDAGHHVLTYPAEFCHAIQMADHARKGQIEDPDPLGAHRNLQRTKYAGMFAVTDGRFDVNGDDIALATAIVETSEVLRRWLEARSATAAQRVRDEGNRRQGSDAADREAAHLDRATARVARALVRRVTDDTATRWTEAALEHSLAFRDRAPYFEAALASLVETGLLINDGGWVHLP